MTMYPISARWRADRDVMSREAMLTRLRESNTPPHGHAWLLVGTRRSGKTWTLDALAHHLGDGARTHDLRTDGPLKQARWLLIDEPGKRIEADAHGFAKECAKLKQRGAAIVLALTPAELTRLRAAAADTSCFSHKSLLQTPAVTDAMARQLARRPEDEALVDALPTRWRRDLYLLQTLLHIAEHVPVAERVIEVLCTRALDLSAGARAPYLPSVFGESLTGELRDALRAVARGDAAPPHTDELAHLGLIARNDAHTPWRIENAALHAALAPLRIHHLSDVHVGPKTATEVDRRFGGVVALDLTRAAAAENVRQSYLAHLRSRPARAQEPHLVSLIDQPHPAGGNL